MKRPDILEGIDVSALPPPWNERPEVVVCVLADNDIAHPSHGWCPGLRTCVCDVCRLGDIGECDNERPPPDPDIDRVK